MTRTDLIIIVLVLVLETSHATVVKSTEVFGFYRGYSKLPETPDGNGKCYEWPVIFINAQMSIR
jgi:hypothetical protein